MRKIFSLSLLAITVFTLPSCLKDKITHTYSILRPIYKEKAEVYANIKSDAAREIEQPGKIFLYGNYIFLNEVDKGVHIIDNSNPSSPQVKGFIEIPGNLDIAVKGNTLYADLYSDLVVVDITNPMAARFEKFIAHVFPDRIYSNGFVNDSTKVIVGWIKKDTTVPYEIYRTGGWGLRDAVLFSYAGGAAQAGPQGPLAAAPAFGVAGSMARFSIVNNFMYCVNNSQLRSFDIANSLNPQQVNITNMGWGIETIYPFQNKLFIGSSTGMFIYDISNPSAPVRQGQFTHARACDPVITDGSHAYVTLHDGTECGNTLNQLDVVNVANLSSPTLVRSYALTHPHGLSKAGNLLFICDGKDGLKMYDASSPGSIVLRKQIKGIETYDAIAWNNNLIVVAKDGLYQYEYSEPANLVQRSHLTLNR
jgi:hypothetical protein